MERVNSGRERRKSSRFDIDWPLEYKIADASEVHGGIAVNGSDVGLCIHSLRNMSVGTRLNLAVIYRKEFQLTCLEVVAEITWKDLCLKEDWNGYQYGLEFLQIKDEELRELKKLFPSLSRNRGES